MSIPVRCFSCGKILGTVEIYNDICEVKTKNDYLKIFEKYDITRYCCKTLLLTFVTVLEELIQ